MSTTYSIFFQSVLLRLFLAYWNTNLVLHEQNTGLIWVNIQDSFAQVYLNRAKRKQSSNRRQTPFVNCEVRERNQQLNADDGTRRVNRNANQQQPTVNNNNNNSNTTVLTGCVSRAASIDQAHFVAKRPILIKVIKNYPLLHPHPNVAVDTPVRYDEPLGLSVKHSSLSFYLISNFYCLSFHVEIVFNY